jgi:hypothetical protein
MSARFISGGLRFYAGAFVVGFVLMLVVPIGIVRALCAFALCAAAGGFALHLYALGSLDPGARARLRDRLGATMRRTRGVGSRVVATTGDAAEMAWPCAVR